MLISGFQLLWGLPPCGKKKKEIIIEFNYFSDFMVEVSSLVFLFHASDSEIVV